MGCPKFFQYHPDANVHDYMERFEIPSYKEAVKEIKSFDLGQEVESRILEEHDPGIPGMQKLLQDDYSSGKANRVEMRERKDFTSKISNEIEFIRSRANADIHQTNDYTGQISMLETLYKQLKTKYEEAEDGEHYKNVLEFIYKSLKEMVSRYKENSEDNDGDEEKKDQIEELKQLLEDMKKLIKLNETEDFSDSEMLELVVMCKMFEPAFEPAIY